jgi:transposase InsO family protein
MSFIEANNSKKVESWFLDSGCSNHMCGNKQWFYTIDEDFRNSVKLGNEFRMEVMGKGNIRLEINGAVQVVTDVYYVPDLKNNLLSVGQLQERGLTLLIQNGTCKLYHPRRGLIMQTKMTANRMFVLLASVVFQETSAFLQSATEDNSQLWHHRFGHLSYKGLRTLQYKQMVKGLPLVKASDKSCTECLVGKQHRDVIQKKTQWRASHKLQLVHADICGPITPNSNCNKRYFIKFIDDFSRMVWIYFLVEKSEAFTTFKNYKSLVEKESGALIGCLRTDRGGEFTSNEFNEFCKINGIRRQLTTSYTPQKNGVAERKNRTIMNMVRCMLCDKQLPKSFWPEAAKWTVHVLNRSPTLTVKDKTPEEAWSGIKHKVDYFRVFGCLAHVHVPDQRRKKLDDKSMRCVLLGLSDESKAYRLFDLVSGKIIVSRDVIFEEYEGWNWGRTAEEVKRDVLVCEGSDEIDNSSFESEEAVEDTETTATTNQES